MRQSQNPFFSIVLVNYNGAKFLENAILSVISQDFHDYEFIIVDGGSNDDSVNIIKKYANHLSWWISEPDKGQSDAFNKGFARAHGVYYTWINADDMMLPGTLTQVKKAIDANPNYNWFVTDLIYINQYDKILKCNKLMNLPNSVIKYGGHDISPSSYFHRDLFNMVGGFVVDYHYNMDDDLWIKFLMKGYSYKVINHWGWAYRIHEDSKTTATLMGVSSPKIDAEFDVIFKDNHHKCTKVGKLLKRFCKLFFSYPASRYYTLKYKDKDIHLINK